jgi:hypothetical protein
MERRKVLKATALGAAAVASRRSARGARVIGVLPAAVARYEKAGSTGLKSSRG